AVMLAVAAPAHHCLLVAPDGERQEPPLAALALEPLVVDEAVDRLEPGLELLREAEIVVKPLRLVLDLEDHGKICLAPLAARSGWRNVRRFVAAAQERDALIVKRMAHRLEMHQMGRAADLDVALARR